MSETVAEAWPGSPCPRRETVLRPLLQAPGLRWNREGEDGGVNELAANSRPGTSARFGGSFAGVQHVLSQKLCLIRCEPSRPPRMERGCKPLQGLGAPPYAASQSEGAFGTGGPTPLRRQGIGEADQSSGPLPGRAAI